MRVSSHLFQGAGRPRLFAIRSARSKATQHIIREKTKCCLPPRTSQMPSSGCCQLSASQFSSQVRLFQTSYEIGEPYLSYR